ncbi:MAG TPA: DUF2007 domain-containing protein [Rudaea sp.]|nr:DUF2007 domain-containing protein [Rudaea sp.]
MKIAYEAENIIDANLVKNVLESEGIPTFISGQYLTGAIGELPAVGLVKVMVPDSEWPRARTIAQTLDAQLSEDRAAPDADADLLPDPA